MALSSPTLAGRIESASRRGSVTFATGDDASERVSWAQGHDEARAAAGALQARGGDAGARVALLAPTSRALGTVIQATWRAGAAVVVLPLPMRLGSIEEFVAQTRARVHPCPGLSAELFDAPQPHGQGQDDDGGAGPPGGLDHRAKGTGSRRQERHPGSRVAPARLERAGGGPRFVVTLCPGDALGGVIAGREGDAAAPRGGLDTAGKGG